MTRSTDAEPRTQADASRSDASSTNSEPTTTETGSAERATRPAVEVRADETVGAECPYCGRPFGAERARDLHVGEVHGDDCTDAERAAYEAANEAERDDLFYFHLKVVAALGVLYSVIVLVYMFVLGSGLV